MAGVAYMPMISYIRVSDCSIGVFDREFNFILENCIKIMNNAQFFCPIIISKIIHAQFLHAYSPVTAVVKSETVVTVETAVTGETGVTGKTELSHLSQPSHTSNLSVSRSAITYVTVVLSVTSAIAVLTITVSLLSQMQSSAVRII